MSGKETKTRTRKREHGSGSEPFVHTIGFIQTSVANRTAGRPANGHAGRAAGAHQARGQSARHRTTQTERRPVQSTKLAAWYVADAVQEEHGRVHVTQTRRAAVVSTAKTRLRLWHVR